MVQTKQIKNSEKINTENLDSERSSDLDLNNIGMLTDSNIELLKMNGITNLLILGCKTVHQLAAIGIWDERAVMILRKTWKYTERLNMGRFGFIYGDEIIKKYNMIQTLTTGCSSLDRILDGGFKTQTLVDIYGREGAGKTIFIHQLACRSMLPKENGGLDSPAVIYIDCAGGFSMRLMQRLAQHQGLDPDETIKRLCLIAPPTTDVMLYFSEHQLPELIERTDTKLIILDSLSSPFLSEYGDIRQLIREMQNRVFRIIRCLINATLNYNLLVVMTNHVCNNPRIFGQPYVHALKEWVRYESPVIIYMGTKKENIKTIKIEKAPDLPNAQCELEITESGFIEVKKPRKNHKITEL